MHAAIPPLAGHRVEMRRPDRLRSVAPEIAVAEVVGEDEDEVGFLRRSDRDQRQGEGEKEQGREFHG